MNRGKVVALLSRIPILLEFLGENPFKVRAFRGAVRALKGLDEELEEFVKRRALTSLKGIGKSSAKTIEEILKTGRSTVYEELCQRLSPFALELLEIPGLGPKRARKIAGSLSLGSLDELEAACREGRVETIPGFGPKTQARLLSQLRLYGEWRWKARYPEALEFALEKLALLSRFAGVQRVELAGELRRKCSVIESVDLVAAGKGQDILNSLIRRTAPAEVLWRSEQALELRFERGPKLSLQVCEPRLFGGVWALQTGSRDHHRQLEALALDRGLELGEDNGLLRVGKGGSEVIPCLEEEEFFQALGLEWIPPELREGRGEVEAAADGRLPELVQPEEIRGLVHTHTTWSDGAATLGAMVRQAEKRGFEYILISDHSKAAAYAGGLDEKDLKEQALEIAKVQERVPGIRILKGSEVDILQDGTLDFDDVELAKLDVVIASVHNRFSQSKEEMTTRLVRAIENPHVDILGHPTGRLLLERPPYGIDLEPILETAVKTGTALEINASPKRLDLDWKVLREARNRGVQFCICPDAHHIDAIDFVSYGIGVARKGWLGPADIWNTGGVDEFLRNLA